MIKFKTLLKNILESRNEEKINDLLDKIVQSGKESLTQYEKTLLDRMSTDEKYKHKSHENDAREWLDANFNNLEFRRGDLVIMGNFKADTISFVDDFNLERPNLFIQYELTKRKRFDDIGATTAKTNKVYFSNDDLWLKISKDFDLTEEETAQTLVEWFIETYSNVLENKFPNENFDWENIKIETFF